MGGGLRSASKSFAVPISKFQSDVLRLLAAQRSPDSYIAGGIAINRQGPRFSGDIDIFHDSADRQESAVKADKAVLAAAACVKAALLRAMRCGSGLAVMVPAGLVTVVGFVLVRLRGLGERRHACGRGA